MKIRLSVVTIALAMSVVGVSAEYLVKFDRVSAGMANRFLARQGGSLELVSAEGAVYKWIAPTNEAPRSLLRAESSWGTDVVHIERNRKLHIFQSPSLIENRDALLKLMGAGALDEEGTRAFPYPDNPEIQNPTTAGTGVDPLLEKAWGMISIGAPAAWSVSPKGQKIVVAVTDTGVDYNHQDLINNMWRNPKEIAGDGIDNDNNGYVDDIVGWDFAANDNKPYDLSMSLIDIVLKGGNPGHGTHVSGCIGASLNNGMGIVGVAPESRIMALRFITENGQGGTAEAIKAIDYAAANGANVINASWGGESDGESEEDKLLKEAIDRAGQKGVLFMAAAGNGRANGSGGAAGFDIDNDPKAVYPAAYQLDNVFTVAALDSSNAMGTFSNWGKKSVKIGAPGVKVLSTVPGNRYQDTLINLGSMQITWDGTSMATPHVAGAAALVWSLDPAMKPADVLKKLIDLGEPTDSLKDKVASGKRLDVRRVK